MAVPNRRVLRRGRADGEPNPYSVPGRSPPPSLPMTHGSDGLIVAYPGNEYSSRQSSLGSPLRRVPEEHEQSSAAQERRFVFVGSTGNDVAHSESDNDETESVVGSTVSRTISSVPNRGYEAAGRDTGSRVLDSRKQGVIKAKQSFWDAWSNKYLPPEESRLMMKSLERGADLRVERSYLRGEIAQEVIPSAVVLRVRLVFLPGADKAQVNRIEQLNMTRRPPDQKSALWRVTTAGSLLQDISVAEDLSIVSTDVTAKVARAARERSRRARHRRSTNDPLDAQAVTIDSNEVKIVNDLQTGHQDWDLDCTLIEVDANSLVNLMARYRYLINNGGPQISFNETSAILDCMIEDARHFCARSPILFRMSTRARIKASTNTRYGVNHQNSHFQTMTTSRGIMETIRHGTAFFDSLNPSGTRDKTQALIRPRFLQMLVLLLSLLNDTDLNEIAEYLEATYGLKSERRDLELLFLKAIPLSSINSKVFLQALIATVDGPTLSDHILDDCRTCWMVFLKRLVQFGYLLPATIEDLGHPASSWMMKWPSEGLTSTTIFENLQYEGPTLRTFNEIPPVRFDYEEVLSELTVIMTNDIKYRISAADYEPINGLVFGSYSVIEARDSGRRHDLQIFEEPINDKVNEAIYVLNVAFRTFNYEQTAPKGNALTRRMPRIWPRNIIQLQGVSSKARITKNSAFLNDDRLATAYKRDGRKISKLEAMNNMRAANREVQTLLHRITQGDPNAMAPWRSGVDRVRRLLADDASHRQSEEQDIDISDEPIAEAIFSGLYDARRAHVWNAYSATTGISGGLGITSKQDQISDLVWREDGTLIELKMKSNGMTFFATPLKPAPDGQREAEVCRGDTVLLVGRYIVIAEPNVQPNENDEPDTWTMVNWLEILKAEERLIEDRRRANRRTEPDHVVETRFI